MPQATCLLRVLRVLLVRASQVQGRYTTDPENVRDYYLLRIDLHVLHYFCIYLTLVFTFFMDSR